MKKDQDMSTVILISSNLLRNKKAASCIVAWLSEAHNGAWVLIFWSNSLYLYYIRSKPPKILPARGTRLNKKKTKC